jgi:hypothetical protein
MPVTRTPVPRFARKRRAGGPSGLPHFLPDIGRPARKALCRWCGRFWGGAAPYWVYRAPAPDPELRCRLGLGWRSSGHCPWPVHIMITPGPSSRRTRVGQPANLAHESPGPLPPAPDVVRVDVVGYGSYARLLAYRVHKPIAMGWPYTVTRLRTTRPVARWQVAASGSPDLLPLGGLALYGGPMRVARCWLGSKFGAGRFPTGCRPPRYMAGCLRSVWPRHMEAGCGSARWPRLHAGTVSGLTPP